MLDAEDEEYEIEAPPAPPPMNTGDWIAAISALILMLIVVVVVGALALEMIGC